SVQGMPQSPPGGPSCRPSPPFLDRLTPSGYSPALMDHATQVALMRRIFGFFDRRTTELSASPWVNRVSTYTSREQLERERELLFHQQPLFLGLSCDAAEPGAYFSSDHTGVPILVVRSTSRHLQAFVAICRHRGARLVTGSGISPGRFTCPYHGWTYD